ncbi:MAG: metal-dependent hydrolase [Candidatus Acidiferrales bacterium]
MEPITQALTSLTLARVAQKQLPRYGAAMLVVAGVTADLDYASYFAGPESFLRFHRSVLHSLPGSAVMICALAAIFWAAARRSAAGNAAASRPLRFAAALAVCALGAAIHLLFDLASGIGVQLFWPFHQKWFAWNILANIDPWVLALLVAGLLLPEVFHLASEEIGERKKVATGRLAGIITLLLLLVYCGARAGLHSRAIEELNSRDYHGRVPLASGAFPTSLSPFTWRGVISTDSTIETLDFSLAPGAELDPDRAVTRYKPAPSAALDAARNTPAAKMFLRYARFPLASLESTDEGYVFVLRDLRFAPADRSRDNVLVHITLNANLAVTSQEFRYAKAANR